MKTMRKDAAKTYQSLLAAAGEVFAAKGYRDATITEICERAGANRAAVNYHFGDKETLYREAWRYVFAESLEAHPPDGGIPEDALPEERLRGHVSSLLKRIADDSNKEFTFVRKELANPTGLLEEVIREEIGPMQGKMHAMVRELLGPHVLDREVWFCVVSIMNQCVSPMLKKVRPAAEKTDKEWTASVDIDVYANHVVSFSLAGIREIRKQAEEQTIRAKTRKIY